MVPILNILSVLFFRSLTESRKRHEEKQAKAQELREKLLQEKAERLRTLTNKVLLYDDLAIDQIISHMWLYFL